MFSILQLPVLMVCWSSLFVRWRCWRMIIGWNWSYKSVFSICWPFLGVFVSYCVVAFDSVLLSVVLVGQVHSSVFFSVTCELMCTARIYMCGFCAPLCFLVVSVAPSRKSRAKITLSFKWQATGCSLGVCVGTDKVITNIGIYFQYKTQTCFQELTKCQQ
jgi:hypothetical protein